MLQIVAVALGKPPVDRHFDPNNLVDDPADDRSRNWTRILILIIPYTCVQLCAPTCHSRYCWLRSRTYV
jgi:hypothetical protein